MVRIAVVDTETVSGTRGLLSVGLILLEAKGGDARPLGSYFGFSDEHDHGMYFNEQMIYARRNNVLRKSRGRIEEELYGIFRRNAVETAFAYNSSFDSAVVKGHLPSLRLSWLDLMHPARRILAGADHFPAYSKVHPGARLTGTGVLASHYKADDVGLYLGLPQETHVAVEDALLETEIALRLGLFNACGLR